MEQLVRGFLIPMLVTALFVVLYIRAENKRYP